jgi:hypothetical protein
VLGWMKEGVVRELQMNSVEREVDVAQKEV